jgi:hypothetical protein
VNQLLLLLLLVVVAGGPPDCADDEAGKERIIVGVNEKRINAINTAILCFFK